jgi:pyridoxine/pyridoxamine 5'-phosphate oxidase
MRAKNLADLYELSLVDWKRITARLDAGLTQAPGAGGPDRHTCWLITVDPDGRPHVTGVGALWEEDAFWFQSGPHTKKSKNLARDPRCALSVCTAQFDLVVEGEAHRVTDRGIVTTMAAKWSAQGWPASVDTTGQSLTAAYSAPSAGPPPWSLYRITLSAATALAVEEPGGATRWTFDEPT